MKNRIKTFWNRIPPHGQSLVELAIFFPIIIMMLSGLVEFGFLLNYYLNLMDGPREGSRFGADLDPFTGSSVTTNQEFYDNVEKIVRFSITPYTLNNATDDIVISAIMIKDGDVYSRFPSSSTDTYKCAVAPVKNCRCVNGHFTSKFSDADLRTMLYEVYGGKFPQKTGAVLVELYYQYHQELALPWLTVIVPDPIQLHLYSISPLPAAEPPDPTATP